MYRYLQAAVRVAAFPLLFGAAGVIAWAAYTPQTATWLMPLIVGGVVLLASLLERVAPYVPAWNSGRDVRGDLGYIGASAVAVALAEAATWAVVLQWLAAWRPAGAVQWWSDWPMAVQVAAALAIGDFLPYLYHRASHESSGWLWRVHAVHHAPERLRALNFARFHPLNAALTAASTLLPLALLGVPADTLFITAVLHNVHGVLSHSNVDFRLGGLNAVFSMAELHRWHHARDPLQANSNYGATLLLWDWLFRTRRHPPGDVGADGVGLWPGSTLPRGAMAQWAYPFSAVAARWRRGVRAVLRGCGCCAA